MSASDLGSKNKKKVDSYLSSLASFKISMTDRFLNKFCCCRKVKSALYKECVKKLNTELDITRLLRQQRTLDLIIKMIFSKSQLPLLNLLKYHYIKTTCPKVITNGKAFKNGGLRSIMIDSLK